MIVKTNWTAQGMGGTIEASLNGDETMKQEDVRYALSVALNQLHELRDKFAGQICASLLTATSADHDYPNHEYVRDEFIGETSADRVSRISYAYANAMLRAKFKEMQ